LLEAGAEKEQEVKRELEDVFKKVVKFLNKGKYKYFVIGGIAAGTLGEPRLTGDVDVDIIISKKEVGDFLDKAEEAGFLFSKAACIESVRRTGVFQISCGDYHIDFLVASTALETAAFERRIGIKIYGTKGFFPTPEDLILLKIVPGRAKDIADVEGLIARHGNRLDKEYIKTWAMKLCDEAQDMRIWQTLEKLLKD
jgi:hypothetical protein